MRRRKLLLTIAGAAAVLAVWIAAKLYIDKPGQSKLPPVEVKAWVTTGDQSSLLALQEPFFSRRLIAPAVKRQCLLPASPLSQ